MRKVRPLSATERTALENGHRVGKSHSFRIRCQLILLSDKGMSVREISQTLNRDTDTVYSNLKRYETDGLKGLENKCGQGRKGTVLDNASMHHSEEFKDKVKEWQEEDLHIFYLPKYSPHLNFIEILWKKIKYEWLKQHLLIGTESFYAQVDEILLAVGRSLHIDFDKWLLPN